MGVICAICGVRLSALNRSFFKSFNGSPICQPCGARKFSREVKDVVKLKNNREPEKSFFAEEEYVRDAIIDTSIQPIKLRYLKK